MQPTHRILLFAVFTILHASAVQAQDDFILPFFHEKIIGEVLPGCMNSAATQIQFQDTIRTDTLTFTVDDLSAFYDSVTFYQTHQLPNNDKVFLAEIEPGCLSLWRHPSTGDYYVKHSEDPVELVDKNTISSTMMKKTSSFKKMSRQFRSGAIGMDSLAVSIAQYNEMLEANAYDCEDQKEKGELRLAFRLQLGMEVHFGHLWYTQSLLAESFESGTTFRTGLFAVPFRNGLRVHAYYNSFRSQTRNSIGTKSWLRSTGFSGAVSWQFNVGDNNATIYPLVGYGLLSSKYKLQGLDCNDHDRTVMTGKNGFWVSGVGYHRNGFTAQARFTGYHVNMQLNRSIAEEATLIGFEVPAATKNINLSHIELSIGWIINPN
jgi:hypothetical protein